MVEIILLNYLLERCEKKRRGAGASSGCLMPLYLARIGPMTLKEIVVDSDVICQ